MQLQHRYTSDPLVRLLQQWQQADGACAQPQVAERLGQWLGTVDAVRLNGALHAIEALPASGGLPRPLADLCAMQGACEALRADLEALVMPRSARAQPVRGRGAAAEVADAQAQAQFAPYGQRYLGLQKQLEARLGPARAQLREGLARAVPALRQLAALDAALEPMLGVREQRLWALLPTFLEARFVHWQGLEDRQPEPGGWLGAFEQDVQALWRAEVRLRLRPLMGLLDAARRENR